jgi:membrane associated rhomboid family serine protease
MSRPLFSLDPPDEARADPVRDRRHFWRAFRWALAAVAVLWWIKLCEIAFGWDFSALSIRPREALGLFGVLTAPLLHGGLEHLTANTLPLLLLGTLARYHYPQALRRALPLIWLCAGLGTWLWGRDSFHLGASGVTHGLMFLIFVLGIARRDRASIALSMLVFFLYGGMVMTILPLEPGVSWESHLFGAVGGVIAALLWRTLDPMPARKKYSWEIEEELERQAADTQGNEWELPRPDQVPVLWRRPPTQETASILPFPSERARTEREDREPEEPRPPTLH